LPGNENNKNERSTAVVANVALPAEALDTLNRLNNGDSLVAANDSRRVVCTPHNIACWNWALRGGVKSDKIIRPDVFCAYITARVRRVRNPDTLDNVAEGINSLERTWFRVRTNKAALDAIRDDWERDPENSRVIRDASERLAVLMVQANEFTTSNGETNYAICTHFGTDPDEVYGPNFEHWWIDVRGACLETFPTLDGYQVYAGHQPLNGDTMYSINVTGLHQRQVHRIKDLVGIRHWRHDTVSEKCQGCQTAFTFFTRRHHCRRCGKIFCNTCSNHTMTVPDALIRPGGGPERGHVRVCNGCFRARA
jgi:FYVE zinc finger